LVIDEIEPSLYDSNLDNLKRQIEWISKIRALTDIRASWDVFPPDV
jgi:hypothetical protein